MLATETAPTPARFEQPPLTLAYPPAATCPWRWRPGSAPPCPGRFGPCPAGTRTAGSPPTPDATSVGASPAVAPAPHEGAAPVPPETPGWPAVVGTHSHPGVTAAHA